MLITFIMASFTSPEGIGLSPQVMFLLLPLTASIAIIYKTTKLPTITAGNLIKEAATLFASIIVFIAVTAIILLFLSRIIIG